MMKQIMLAKGKRSNVTNKPKCDKTDKKGHVTNDADIEIKEEKR